MQAVSQFIHTILISVYWRFLLGVAEPQIITEVNGSYKDLISPTKSTTGIHQLKTQTSSPKIFWLGGVGNLGLLALRKTSASPMVNLLCPHAEVSFPLALSSTADLADHKHVTTWNEVSSPESRHLGLHLEWKEDGSQDYREFFWCSFLHWDEKEMGLYSELFFCVWNLLWEGL